ncbi:MAG: glutathione-disulfide reductase [Gammaproteobacteria bacterium]|nr:glutathione-disulfide reductase [Gammaproteobacteria bacterium]
MDFDLFVIGAGSGGVRAARMAAARGMRVAVADNKALGGTCVNVGCVPKKLYTYASHFGHDFRAATGFGWQLQGSAFNWPELVHAKQQEIGRLNTIYGDMLTNAGVTIITGFAHMLDANSIAVNGQAYRAKHILLATGSKPYLPPKEWAKHVITSDDIFDLPTFPHRLMVVGAGYIALEFACIFNGLGAKVDVSYRGDSVLRGFDQDVRQFMDGELSKQGINVHYHSNIDSINKTSQGLMVTLDNGVKHEVDQVLVALGREPNLAQMGVAELGIEQHADNTIKVNSVFATNVPSVYALGDVVGGPQLTPVALAEAMTLVDHLYGEGQSRMDYNNIATAVFTHPNIGTVGLTEAEARAAYTAIDIYRSEFRPMKHTLSGSNERSLMKLIVDQTTDRVLGVHVVGEAAGEILQGFAVALKCGATKAQFDQTIGIHPTAAEELVTMRQPIMQ